MWLFTGQILKTLHKTYSNMKLKPIWTDINPKAVTTDELFGFLHPATREWKDGVCVCLWECGLISSFEVHLCRQLSAVVCMCLYALFRYTFECVLRLSIAMRNHMSHKDLK